MSQRRLRRRRADRPRVLALRIMRAVTSDGAYANLEIARVLGSAQLDARDASFVTELVAGTCRLQGTYDRVIVAASGRKRHFFHDDVLDVLRLGAHQILSTRVPVRAAIDASVELAGVEIGEKVVGLVNAILRKVAARDLSSWVLYLSEGEDEISALATRTHHPRWIAAEHVRLLGLKEAEIALAANNEPPITNLVVRPGLAEVAELEGESDRYSPFGAHRLGHPADVVAVQQGRAGVQDEGSQVVAWALTRVEAPEGPWLDLCAGPGGKAALLGGLAIAAGEQLVAAELQPHRAQLIAENVRAYAKHPSTQALAPVVIVADGTRPAWRSGTFARVLADVPCSGLGALRRRPESRWRRTQADVRELIPLQKQLLNSALDSTTPGGVVAYVTCSPHADETVGVVEPVLAERPDVTVLDAPAALPEVPDAALARPRDGEGRYLQLWPHRHQTDGMFCALLRVPS